MRLQFCRTESVYSFEFCFTGAIFQDAVVYKKWIVSISVKVCKHILRNELMVLQLNVSGRFILYEYLIAMLYAKVFALT